MRPGPDRERSTSDPLAGAPNKMIQSARRAPEVCSRVPVAAPPLMLNAHTRAPDEYPDVEAHLKRLLRDVDCLRREREAAASLSQQAEITRELDELYGQIGRARALASKRCPEAPVPYLSAPAAPL